MIPSSLRSKELVSGLIDLLTTALNHNLVDDAEELLGCVRGLRPGVVELDTFEGWIAARRGQWAQAIQVLHFVESNAPKFMLGKAMLAFCQYAIGDPAWEISANEVLQNSNHPDAINLLRLLMSPDAELMAQGSPGPNSEAAAGESATDAARNDSVPMGTHLRA